MPTARSQLLTKRSLHGRVLEVCVDLNMGFRMDEAGGAIWAIKAAVRSSTRGRSRVLKIQGG